MSIQLAWEPEEIADEIGRMGFHGQLYHTKKVSQFPKNPNGFLKNVVAEKWDQPAFLISP